MKVHLNWTYLKYQSQVAVNMFSLWQTYSIVITCKSTVPVPVPVPTKVDLGTVCKASCSQNGHLMLSMISYLNLSSGVYIPLY